MRSLEATQHRQAAVLLMRVKGHTAARKVVDRSMHAYELTDQKRAKRTGEARAKSEDAKKHNKDAKEPSTKEDASFLGHTVGTAVDEYESVEEVVQAGLNAAAEAEARADARAKANPSQPSTPQSSRGAPSPSGASASRGSASRQQEASAPQLIPVGALVVVHGLQAAAELNDEIGVVVGTNESNGRYLVELLEIGAVKAFKLENLNVLEAPRGAFQEGFAAGADDDGASTGGSQRGTEDKWAPGGDDAEMVDAFKECMPLVHDTLWSATALDIEATLNLVIHRVLKDMSVDKTVRRQRAQALLKLGHLLQEPHLKRKADIAAEAKARGSLRLSKEQELTPEPPDMMSSERSPTGSTTTTGSKRSMLLRLKSRGMPSIFRSRPSTDSRKDKEVKLAKEAESKRKSMEAAMAMMAAGATTEEVDEMLKMRAQMDAECG
mmetsp:Transcript_12937/g.29200  ORF Transcript_12937/g.29200 Transcript_12937/m.29200 type:complete len:437 (+) Transcript_12937:533-1843(+)